MAEEFKVIETQEQLDAVIKQRIERERSKYADYESLKAKGAELETQIGALKQQLENAASEKAASSKTIEDLTAKVKAHETASAKTAIALEVGIPYELAQRLNGETPEDIRKDAEKLLGVVRSVSPTAPLYNPDQAQTDKKDAALRGMLKDLSV